MSPDEWHQGAQLAEKAISLLPPGGAPRSLKRRRRRDGLPQNEGNRFLYMSPQEFQDATDVAGAAMDRMGWKVAYGRPDTLTMQDVPGK